MIADIWKIVCDELQAEELACHVREDVFSLFLRSEDREMLIGRLDKISDQINRKAKELQVKGIHSRCGIYEMNGAETPEDAYSKAQMASEYAREHNNQLYVFYRFLHSICSVLIH